MDPHAEWFMRVVRYSKGNTVVAPRTFTGRHGWWLRNGVVEAFVCSDPGPRVVTFRRPGKSSLIQCESGRAFFGVRSCFMEPAYNAQSGLPNLLSAAATYVDSRRVCLETPTEPESLLRLLLDVSIDSDTPRLRVRHGFSNSGTSMRRIAPWALTVVPAEGIGLTPWRTGSETIRSYLLFFNTDPGEPCLKPGKDALAIDFRIRPKAAQIKVGTNTDAGWAAYVSGGQALFSAVTIDKDAAYPEENSTVTFYSTHGDAEFTDETFCELEHVGPLTDLAPGETAWMEQTLQILDGVDTMADSADDLLRAVMLARKEQNDIR